MAASPSQPPVVARAAPGDDGPDQVLGQEKECASIEGALVTVAPATASPQVSDASLGGGGPTGGADSRAFESRKEPAGGAVAGPSKVAAAASPLDSRSSLGGAGPTEGADGCQPSGDSGPVGGGAAGRYLTQRSSGAALCLHAVSSGAVVATGRDIAGEVGTSGLCRQRTSRLELTVPSRRRAYQVVEWCGSYPPMAASWPAVGCNASFGGR